MIFTYMLNLHNNYKHTDTIALTSFFSQARPGQLNVKMKQNGSVLLTAGDIYNFQEFTNAIGPLVSNPSHMKTLVSSMNVLLSSSTLPVKVGQDQATCACIIFSYYLQRISLWCVGLTVITHETPE